MFIDPHLVMLLAQGSPPAPATGISTPVPLWAFLATAVVTLTIGIASLVISIITLQKTISSADKRELEKWRRDIMVEHLQDFLDCSATIKQIVGPVPFECDESVSQLQTKMLRKLVLLQMVSSDSLMEHVLRLFDILQDSIADQKMGPIDMRNAINSAQIDLVNEFRLETGVGQGKLI